MEVRIFFLLLVPPLIVLSVKKELADHLMKDENEVVRLYELRGFVARDLLGASRLSRRPTELHKNQPEEEILVYKET